MSSTRFPRTHRLLRPAEFTAVLHYPTVNKSTGPLRIRAIQNRMPFARLGVTVPKKGNRRAVRRNRIKRIVREQFRHRQADLAGHDLVVQVFAAIEDEALKLDLDGLLNEMVHQPGNNSEEHGRKG